MTKMNDESRAGIEVHADKLSPTSSYSTIADQPNYKFEVAAPDDDLCKHTVTIGKTSKLGFRLEENGVDPRAPLLYRIWVQSKSNCVATTLYVGQTKNGSKRPFTRYDLNVRRLLKGKPALNGRGYRPVHMDLLAAHRLRHEITIELVHNIDLSTERITDAERRLQSEYGLTDGERRRLTDSGEPL